LNNLQKIPLLLGNTLEGTWHQESKP